MNSIRVSLFTFVCIFGGVLLGMLLRGRIPKEHMSGDSKDAIKMGMGLVGTMVALVLGLLVASAKGQFDSQSAELTQSSVNIVLIEGSLAHYGPEANGARAMLRDGVARTLDQFSSGDRLRTINLEPTGGALQLYQKIEQLSPQNDVQRSLQTQALSLVLNLAKSRWLMYERQSTTLPVPLLGALTFWLAITFVSFGLLAPSNATSVVSLFIAALSVSWAVFLILEMYSPQTGIITISTAPLRTVFEHLGSGY